MDIMSRKKKRQFGFELLRLYFDNFSRQNQLNINEQYANTTFNVHHQLRLSVAFCPVASIPMGQGDVSPNIYFGGHAYECPQYMGVFVLETSIFSRHLIARSPSVCSNKQRLTAAAAYFLSEKL